MKILELFAGSKSVSNIFAEAGHETFSIDWSRDLPNIDWYADIATISANDILERFGKPDIIWASPDCKTYSVAAISKHRVRESDGNLLARTKYASFCDMVNEHAVKLIKELNPLYFFIENPRGGLRKMNFIKWIPRYTVTYCQWGDERMKPTDIWTNHPDPQFRPPCKNGDPCHTPAPRGSQTGTQGLKNAFEKAKIPEDLCRHIMKICTNRG